MRGLQYRIEDWGVALLAGVARLLPDALRGRLGAALGRCMGLVLPGLAKTARENVAAAYPEWDDAQVRRLVRANFSHVGRMALEFFGSGAKSAEDFRREIRVEGLDVMDQALAEGKGVLLLTGHLGNWELGGYVMALRGYKVHFIWRRMKNPFVERRVLAFRARFGAELIPHRQAVRPVMKALKQGGVVAFLLDQRARGKEFVPSTFFGRPVATNQGLALLALRTGAPVVYGYCVREEGGYVMRVVTRVEPPETQDREAALLEYTHRFDRLLEAGVRSHPEQWFWFHKRWRLPDRFPRQEDASGGAGEGGA